MWKVEIRTNPMLFPNCETDYQHLADVAFTSHIHAYLSPNLRNPQSPLLSRHLRVLMSPQNYGVRPPPDPSKCPISPRTSLQSIHPVLFPPGPFRNITSTMTAPLRRPRISSAPPSPHPPLQAQEHQQHNANPSPYPSTPPTNPVLNSLMSSRKSIAWSAPAYPP